MQLSATIRTETCEKDGCGKIHHTILHNPDYVGTTVPKELVCSSLVWYMCATDVKVLTKVLPIILRGPSGEVKTFAMLDYGSEVTILEQSIADKLGLKGLTESFHLKTVNGISSEVSHHVSLQIQGETMERTFSMDNVRTLPILPLRHQAVNISKLQQCWKHLCDAQLPSLKNARPTILIGKDHGELIVTRECVTGPWKSPILSRTSFGWVVHGTIASYRGFRSE